MDMDMGPAGLSANQSQTPAKKPMVSQQAAVPVIALAQIAMTRPRGLSSVSVLQGLRPFKLVPPQAEVDRVQAEVGASVQEG